MVWNSLESSEVGRTHNAGSDGDYSREMLRAVAYDVFAVAAYENCRTRGLDTAAGRCDESRYWVDDALTAVQTNSFGDDAA